MSQSPTVEALHAIEDITAEMVLILRLAGYPVAASGFACAIAAKLQAAKIADCNVRDDLKRLRG